MNKFFSPLPALLCILPLFWQCRNKPDLESEKQQLLQLHAAQQTAHLQKNAALFVGQFDENMMMINRGKITSDGREKTRARVQQYFNAVEFKKWEDCSPPQISFSDDASMAYVVVDKLVVLTRENDRQESVEESTHFGWVSIYKKQRDGAWKMVCNASTNEAPVEQKIALPAAIN